jgi:site-specific DNA-methyltransferase (adenine-specific)
MDELKNKVIEADCLEFMKTLPDKSIDLILTDPPYGIKADSKPIRGKFTHANLNFDTARPTKEYFDEMQRVASSCVIWGGNYFADLLPPTMGWLVWDKELRGFSLADGELAWTSINRAMRIFKQNRPNVRAKDGKWHPTQKSVDLMKFCMDYVEKTTKQKVNLVLDPFAGSGTTGVACKNTNRNYILIEKEPEYIQIIKQRLQ